MSDDLRIFLEDFVGFLNGLEASIVKMRKQIEKLIGPTTDKLEGSTELPFDASKIAWQKRVGQKGEFELSEDFDNPEHKALLKFLNEADGCITSEGYFYWIWKNGSTVGRKKREVKG